MEGGSKWGRAVGGCWDLSYFTLGKACNNKQQQQNNRLLKREVWLGTLNWCFDHFLNPTTLTLSDLNFLTHQQIKNLVIHCTCKHILCSKLSCFQDSNNNNPLPHSWPWIWSWDKQLSAQCSPLESIKISRASLTMTSHPLKGKVWGISGSEVTQSILSDYLAFQIPNVRSHHCSRTKRQTLVWGLKGLEFCHICPKKKNRNGYFLSFPLKSQNDQDIYRAGIV